MGRLIVPFQQFIDGNGDPVPGGKLSFFDNKTSIKRDTFSDEALTILNSNPVILDGSGYLPKVFGQGKYTASLDTKDNVFTGRSFDDIIPEGESGTASFNNWSSALDYLLPSYVTGSDGLTYKAIASSTNIDPVTDDGSTWIKIEFISFYSAFVTYSIGQQVKVLNNDIYKSLKNSNINNEPITDGSVNWQKEDPTQLWITGKLYVINDLVYGSNGRTYKAVISQSGNEPVADGGTNWLPIDGVVETPVNTSPANSSTGVSRIPTLVSSSYSINGSTNPHEYSRYKIYLDVGLTNPVYDSQITTDLTSHTITTQLSAATEHFWVTSHKGIRTDISNDSSVTSFTTTINLSLTFDIENFSGTGAALSVITTVDLNTNSGTVWVADLTTASEMRVMDTTRGVGNAIFLGVAAFNETSEVNGLTAFNVNGFSLGNDVNYNAVGDSIWTLSLKVTPGVFDIVPYSGDGTNRTTAHNLGTEVGAMICLQKSGAAPASSPRHYSWHKGFGGLQFLRYANLSAVSSIATAWNSTNPTSSSFSLGTLEVTNGVARDYVMYLFAHNPNAGIFCGSQVGTGSSGNKVVTGFPVTTYITKSRDSNDDWIILDKNLGTSSHILLDGNSQSIAGGAQSFDSDGITLGGVANDNTETYIFIAMADPAIF